MRRELRQILDGIGFVQFHLSPFPWFQSRSAQTWGTTCFRPHELLCFCDRDRRHVQAVRVPKTKGSRWIAVLEGDRGRWRGNEIVGFVTLKSAQSNGSKSCGALRL